MKKLLVLSSVFLIIFSLSSLGYEENNVILETKYQNSLKISLEFTTGKNQGESTAGCVYNLSIILSNISDQEITLSFLSAKLYDLIIIDNKGNTVWNLNKDKMFAMMITRISFPPDTPKKEAVTLPDGIFFPGEEYTITFSLNTEDHFEKTWKQVLFSSST